MYIEILDKNSRFEALFCTCIMAFTYIDENKQKIQSHLSNIRQKQSAIIKSSSVKTATYHDKKDNLKRNETC